MMIDNIYYWHRNVPTLYKLLPLFRRRECVAAPRAVANGEYQTQHRHWQQLCQHAPARVNRQEYYSAKYDPDSLSRP